MMESTVLPNTQQLAGVWNQIKGELKRRWGQISEDELEKYKGSVDQLLGYLQRTTGETRDQVEAYLAQAYDVTSGAMEKARSMAADYTWRAAEALQQQYQQMSQRLSEGYSGAQDFVRNRPAESLAVAFGTGLICGIMVALMLRSR